MLKLVDHMEKCAVTKVVKVTVFFVSENPSHDFCCAYLERHNISFVNYPWSIFIKYGLLIIYSKNLYLIITNYSMMTSLRQRNLVAQYLLS